MQKYISLLKYPNIIYILSDYRCF